MSWIKDKLVKYVFKDYVSKYVKPLIDKVINFFDGKKTILSLLAFGLAQYATANPGGAVTSIVLQVLDFLAKSYGVAPSLDGITAAAIIGLAIGAFDKLRKWASGDKAVVPVLPEV